MAPGAPRRRPRAAMLLTGAAALLVYAGLALGSGLDRMSAGQPSLAPRVPGLFASEALRAMGAQALGRGDAAAALRIGQQALRDAPTDPQSAALFGAGNLASKARWAGSSATAAAMNCAVAPLRSAAMALAGSSASCSISSSASNRPPRLGP